MFASAVSSTVPTSLSKSPESGLVFEEVLEGVSKRSDLALEDQVLPLSQLHATDDGLIQVPTLGKLALTDWSRRQLATILGIRWDKWFASDVVVPADRAQEINRRFQATGDLWKIRAQRLASGEEPRSDAVLRAFVSPTYAPIDDLEIFRAMGKVLADRLDRFRFVRVDTTTESSQYAAASLDEIDFGLGKPDHHRNGFLLVNSDVGSRSLLICAWIWRLKCRNGLVTPDSTVFRMIHRRRKDVSLNKRLVHGLGLIPEHWNRSMTYVRRARQETIIDVKSTLEMMINGYRELRPISQAVFAAYDEEPESTLFSLVQAITRAAQTLPPERRLAIEEYAGRLIVGSPKLEALP